MQLGWIPDLPDKRDHYFSGFQQKPLQPKKTLRFPFVYDQGKLGSCTAQAVAALCQYREIEQNGSAPNPSRLEIYYWTRFILGTVNYDSGGTLRDAIKAVHRYGIAKETTWPYEISNFMVKPNEAARKEAEAHKIVDTAYARVLQDQYVLRATLAAGNPIVFGFTVYESFMSEAVAKSGVVPMPEDDEKVRGGHAVVLIGYDDDKASFLVKNSWGKSWGYQGNFWLPYAFVRDNNFADDFWTIYKIKPLST